MSLEDGGRKFRLKGRLSYSVTCFDQPLVSDDITLACIHKMHFLRFDNMLKVGRGNSPLKNKNKPNLKNVMKKC